MMSDSILASIIAAVATLSASLLQLRFSFAKELGARTASTGRRKSRGPLITLAVVVCAAGVGGFALSQGFIENERAARNALERELRTRAEEANRSASRLEVSREDARAEIEANVLRRLGADGVVVMATLAACHPAPLGATTAPTSPGPPALGSPPGAPACAESEGTSVTLCATVPASATVTAVQLFSRFADAEVPWSASRLNPGQESAQARFAESYTESNDAGGTKQVCQAFTHWSTEHGRSARMIVHYAL